MAGAVLNAVEAWTGDRPDTCPWRAFYDTFVKRVMWAYRFFETGQLAWALPRPSHRLVCGIAHFHQALRSVEHKQIEEERRNREARAER
jgi:hypothetical protein